jgi:hypothetical protein
MIDEPEYDVTGANPPEELPYWGSPKWSDEPHSHDPDRSPLFETVPTHFVGISLHSTVWFVPIQMIKILGDAPVPNMHYWVRVDDNVGSWTIGGDVDPCDPGNAERMSISTRRPPEPLRGFVNQRSATNQSVCEPCRIGEHLLSGVWRRTKSVWRSF